MIKYNKQKWGNLMKFFKENSYDIVKLLINQIGIAIFSMTLYFSIALIEDANLKSTLNLLVSIFSTLFYYALIYTAAWEFGAKDKIRIDGGKMEKCSFKGLFMAIYANIPNFLIVGSAVICKIVHYNGGAEGFNFVFGILNAIFRFFMSMYLYMIDSLFSFSDVDTAYLFQSIAFLVVPVIVIGVTQLAYFLGSREWRFISLFSDKKTKS